MTAGVGKHAHTHTHTHTCTHILQIKIFNLIKRADLHIGRSGISDKMIRHTNMCKWRFLMSRQAYNGNMKISDKHYLYGLRLLQADMSVLFVLIKQAAVQNMGSQIRHTSIGISTQRFLGFHPL